MLFNAWVADGRRLASVAAAGDTGDEAKRKSSEFVPTLELIQPSDAAQFAPAWRLIWKVPGAINYWLNTYVFPDSMRAQSVKISASGQELGSGMVFGSRIGFSGTPSNLLPAELRPCHFEEGSEGKIVRVLTDPAVCDRQTKVGGSARARTAVLMCNVRTSARAGSLVAAAD
jgi:hypothetical protein